MPIKRLQWRFAQTIGLLGAIVMMVLAAAEAHATVTIPTPRGWSQQVDQRTRARVDSWADAADGRISMIAAAREDDEADEVLAVIELRTPLGLEVFGEGEGTNAAALAALQADAAALFGISGDAESTASIAGDAPGVGIVHARWTVQDETFFVGLAPTGRTHVAIILVIPTRDTPLYGSIFSDSVAQFRGAVAFVKPFERGPWLGPALGLWLVLAGVLTVAFAKFSLRTEPMAIATRATLALAAASVLVGVVAYNILGDHAPSLAAAGLSPSWMAVQLAGLAVVPGLAILIGGAIWERRTSPVASAPAGGTFSARATQHRPSPRPTRRPTPVGELPASLVQADSAAPPPPPPAAPQSTDGP